MDEFMEFVRERINSLIEIKIISEGKKKISDRQISRDLGKYDSYINDLLAGRFVPSIKMLDNISNYFGITLLEFFNPNYDPGEKLLKDILGEKETHDFYIVAKNNPEVVKNVVAGLIKIDVKKK